jgi:hypothetical protein
MRVKAALLLSCCWLPLIGPARRTAVAQLPRDMVRIEGGSFRPLYAPTGAKVAHLESFAIDTVPVSIASKDAKADEQATRRPNRVGILVGGGCVLSRARRAAAYDRGMGVYGACG